MSFNQDVKNEIIISSKERDFRFSLLSGFLRLGSEVNLLGENKISLTVYSYNPSTARFIKKELKELFEIDSKLEIKKSLLNRKNYYNLRLKAEEKKLIILYQYLEILKNDQYNLLMKKTPTFIKSSKRSIKGYLTGLFLAKGVIINPTHAYRYSIENINKKNAEDIIKLFEKLNLSIKIKIHKKDNSYLLSCTNSENILDILALMKLTKSYAYFENTIIQKQNKKRANRQRNIEFSNIKKISESAARQIENILIIKNEIGLNTLPKNLEELSLLRLENEDLSLAELSKFDNVSKNTLYTRFKKIEKIANEVGIQNG